MRQTIRRSIPRRGSTGRPLLYWKVMDMKGTQAMDHVRDELASADMWCRTAATKTTALPEF